jgi:hypothetical protein
MKLIEKILEIITPVSRRRYRKSLEILRSLEKLANDRRGDQILAERNLHYALGDLTRKMSTWVAKEKGESIDIGLRIDKEMARAALQGSPEEFKKFLAQQLAARVIQALNELEEDREAQLEALNSHKPSKIIRP